MMRKWFTFFAVILLAQSSMQAHEVRPAYLGITQINDSTYQIIWKIPALENLVPKIYPVFPKNWSIIKDAARIIPGAARRELTFQSKGKINGDQIYIDGLASTMIDVLVNIELNGGEKYSQIISADKPFYVIPSEPDSTQVIKTYTVLGVEHILFGIDHLLFVLALIIITKGFGKIVKTITAFTLAHSITLSVAVLGVANLPGPPVEAVIALSIVFLAAEIIKNIDGKETLTSRKPWLVAFTFGLLHGFGFAGALSEVGLPQTEIPLALAFFNIGVELGQIGFVIVVLLFIRVLMFHKNYPIFVKKIPAYAIGAISSFWVIERIAGFF